MNRQDIESAVRKLSKQFEQDGQHIADLLAEMPLSDEQARRDLYHEVLLLLVALQKYARDWAATYMEQAYRDSEMNAVASLEIAGIVRAEDFALPDVSQIDGIYREFDDEVRSALSSVQSIADAFRSNRGVTKYLDSQTRLAFLAGAVSAVVAANLRRQLRQNLAQSFVTILSSSGRVYTYSLPYYITLSATTKLTSAATNATMSKAKYFGHDLLRVSPQPSTIGDYCDEYAGLIVSISGASEKYIPMAYLPNGGAPFHPWCHHFMEIFVDGMSGKSIIGTEFLEAGKLGTATPNDYQKIWKAAGQVPEAM